MKSMGYEMAAGWQPAKIGEIGPNAPFLRQLLFRSDSHAFASLRLHVHRAPIGAALRTFLGLARTAFFSKVL
jgi:hypothetical protein